MTTSTLTPAYTELAANLKHLDDTRKATKALRRLWVLSNATCWRCKKQIKLSKATRDHIIPRALGGTNKPSNLRLACYPCNNGRGSQLPDRPVPDPVAGVPGFLASHGKLPRGGARDYNTVAKLYRVRGGRCWLCDDPVLIDEVCRSRIDITKGWAMANLRLAHWACEARRGKTNNAWKTHLWRSRAARPAVRLRVRRRAAHLKTRVIV